VQRLVDFVKAGNGGAIAATKTTTSSCNNGNGNGDGGGGGVGGGGGGGVACSGADGDPTLNDERIAEGDRMFRRLVHLDNSGR
jgi:hypothetical protein